MDIKVSNKQGRRPVTVLHIAEDLNSSNYAEFENKVREVVLVGARDIVIDLAKCDYVSSAGMRVLNSTILLLRTDAPEESNEAMNKGLRDGTWKSPHLKLANVPARVTEVLRIAGLDMLIESHPSVKKAVDSF